MTTTFLILGLRQNTDSKLKAVIQVEGKRGQKPLTLATCELA